MDHSIAYKEAYLHYLNGRPVFFKNLSKEDY